MDVSFKGIARLVAFIDTIEKETYPETPSPQHLDITASVLETLLPQMNISTENRILDVGCGQGPALDIFRSKGYTSVVGITLNDTDVSVCRNNGHHVLKMDQSFLEFENESFDFLWARHVIEHSIFPYFTLSEFNRVLSPGGRLYLEVPAPETSVHHETNPNHYSVLGLGPWVALLNKSGFSTAGVLKHILEAKSGTDEYWGFICTKNP